MKNLVDLMNFRHTGDLSDGVSLYCKKIGNVEKNHNAMGRIQGECKPQKSRKLKIFGFLLVALLLLVAGGAYYLDYQKRQTAEIDQMQTDIPAQRQNLSELAVAENNQSMAEAGEEKNLLLDGATKITATEASGGMLIFFGCVMAVSALLIPVMCKEQYVDIVAGFLILFAFIATIICLW